MNKTTVYERITNLLETGEFSDETFLIKSSQKMIHGHKLLFKMASPVFAAIMNGDWLEKDVIEIDDVDFEAFKTLMQFIYTDKLKLNSVSHAAAVYRVADKYDVPFVEETAEEYILTNLKSSDVCEILEFVKLFNKTKIEEACMMILKLETEPVLDSVGFLECSLDTLEIIAGDPDLNVDEIKLFTSVEKWAEHNATKRGVSVDILYPMLSAVLRKIRFLSMTVDEFCKGPNKSDILPVNERQNLFMILNGEGNANLPEGYCLVTSPRKRSDLQLVTSLRENGKYIQIKVRWKMEKILFVELHTDYYSPQFLFNNFIWKISLKQTVLLGRKYLNINLICDCVQRDNEADWSCAIKYKFRIINQNDRNQDFISTSLFNIFNKENNVCGWNPILAWSMLTYPDVSPVRDGCIIIEVKLSFVE